MDELLEVERDAITAHMLSRDRGAPNDDHVGARGSGGWCEGRGALRAHRCHDRDAGGLEVCDALRDEVEVDWLRRVDLLHPRGDPSTVEAGNLTQERLRILVAAPDSLEVEGGRHAEGTECANARRRHDGVHRGRNEREVEVVGVDGPGGRHLLGIAGSTARGDRDLVE